MTWTPRHIGLVKPSALGDIVHSLPVLSALRKRYPRAKITWVVNRAYESLLAGHPHLDATLPFDRGVFKQGLIESLTYSCHFSCILRRQRFDLVVDLQGLLRTGLMCAATGAPRRIGFASAREGATRFYTHCVEVPDADSIHAVDRYWRIAEALGAADQGKEFLLPISREAQDQATRLLAGWPRPWYALAVGSRWVTKCWPAAHYAELLTRAQLIYGGTVIFVGTSDDTLLSREVASQLPGHHLDLTGRTNLPLLAATLARSDMMIGNDTGPLHLASALGRPCVAPYTCTKIALHGPYGSQNACLEASVPCAGSYLKQCPRGMICMQDLTPEKLWAHLSQVLMSLEQRHQSA